MTCWRMMFSNIGRAKLSGDGDDVGRQFCGLDPDWLRNCFGISHNWQYSVFSCTNFSEDIIIFQDCAGSEKHICPILALILWSSGDEVISTLYGDDFIAPSLGNDKINSGEGNDTIYVNSAGKEVDGGAGDDELWLDFSLQEYEIVTDGNTFYFYGPDDFSDDAFLTSTNIEKYNFSSGAITEESLSSYLLNQPPVLANYSEIAHLNFSREYFEVSLNIIDELSPRS